MGRHIPMTCGSAFSEDPTFLDTRNFRPAFLDIGIFQVLENTFWVPRDILLPWRAWRDSERKPLGRFR
eukprot:1158712-Pelagomonas_calceolata.AAC.2